VRHATQCRDLARQRIIFAGGDVAGFRGDSHNAQVDDSTTAGNISS